MTRRVVVTGAGGQVGRELQRASWDPSFDVVPLTSTDLDITDPVAVAAVLTALEPSIIVNAAAYTAVDAAEDDEATATLVNATAVGHLADSADRLDAPLIHLSTDYVFDGTKDDWYDEEDPVSPVGAYGRSKAAGELTALGAGRGVVLRTAWVYGALGSNFVTTMLRLAAERDALGVVDDQVGCPTAAIDIAATIVDVTTRLLDGPAPPHRLYHVAAPDSATWHDVAMATFDASAHGFDGVCARLTTSEYPTRAIRPANSRLRSDRLEADFGYRLPSWRNSLRSVVTELERQR